MENKVLRTFFFGAVEVSALRKLLPLNLPRCSTFELLVAVLWRTRTLAMNHHPSEEVQMICVVGARPKFDPPLPKGYYGNAIAHPAVKTTAGYLTGNPIASALEIIQKAKNSVTGEYMKSLADYLVLNGRPSYTGTAFLVSGVTRVGLEDTDYGWGKAIYGAPPRIGSSGMSTFFVSLVNKYGEKGIGVPIYLPCPAMEIFVKEMNTLLEVSSGNRAAPKL